MKSTIQLNSATFLAESKLNIILDILRHHCIDLEVKTIPCMSSCVMHVGNYNLGYNGETYTVENDMEYGTINLYSYCGAGVVFAHEILSKGGMCRHCTIDK